MEGDVRLVERCRVTEDEFENYDVFISHRGPDTKSGFVGFLYDYLEDAGLRPFLDCKSILKGQDAWTCIEHAIKMTPIALVIFSKNFAQSQWCLDELHVMLGTPGIKVLPVFYKVKPFEVGFPERGRFAAAFEKLVQRHDEIVIKQWREDLERASKLNGWEHRASDHSLEQDLVKAIVEEVLELANKPLPLDVGEHMFGVNKVAEGIIQKLADMKKVMVLGLWGMGGIGKSTLAKELYNRLSKRFAGACYVEDVREKVDESDGVTKVQNHILNDLGREGVMSRVSNKSMGKAIMEERLYKKCILLVLDDVCNDDKLSFLVSRKMFREGSLCIVTSRDKRVFNAFRDYEVHIHDVQGLGSLDSRQVVASYAFGDHEKVEEGFKDLVGNISKACGGIPLVLKVCGALLKNEEDVDVWRDVLKKLKSGSIRDDWEIFERLRISYDALQKDYQEMFLDISCALLGKSRSLSVRAWDSHGWPGALGIRSLVEKALVTVDKNGCLCMHDQLRDMGHEIVRRRRESDGVIRRLWMPESSTFLEGDVEGLLESLETLVVFYWPSSHNNDLDISRMKKLRILMCDDSSKVTSSIPRNLCWWDWDGPWFRGRQSKRILPTVLRESKLVVLNLQRSEIIQFPETFGWLTNMESLNLRGCEKLLMLPESFHGLTKLRDLNLESSAITTLPKAFGGLVSLEVLNLSNCMELNLKPELIGALKMIRDLNLERCGFSSLPEAFGDLTNLEVLNLGYCLNLVFLPNSFGNLNKLRDLNVKSSGISSLPESFGGLSKLEVLNLAACRKLLFLPHSIRRLQNVKDFSYLGSGFGRLLEAVGELDDFEMLNIPAKFTKLSRLLEILSSHKQLQLANYEFADAVLLESFGDFSNLEMLDLRRCSNLVLLPKSFCTLGMLQDLNLERCGFSRLPEAFGDLTNLDVLNLGYCLNLVFFPNSFGNLNNLRDLNLEWSGISSLPESFGGLSKLEVLNLTACKKLFFLPHSIRCLQNVKVFSYAGSAFWRLVQEVGESDDFKRLSIPSQVMKLLNFFEMLYTLKQLQLAGFASESLPESFGDLSNLEVLDLSCCSDLVLLPKSFGNLTKLQSLNLGRSGISNLPESFGELVSLEVLNLSYCMKMNLQPKLIGDLKMLRDLNMEGSQITWLLESFGELSNLEVLNLSKCEKLHLLPELFGGLSKFRDLNLESSGISSLPESFGELSNLEVLNLSKCEKLHLLPELFGGLSKLRDLNLERSGISSLPESFGELSNLEVLNLFKCEKLHLLPELFGGLSKLRDLNLESSGISSLPESFGGLSKLEVLNLTACQKLLFLPHSIRCLQNVKEFLYLGSGFGRLLEAVGELDNFEMLNIPSKFTKLSRLLEVLSTHKQLQLGMACGYDGFATAILPLLGHLNNLEVLSLPGFTQLELLPSSFGALRKLQDLNLENSGVRSLPESFGDLSNLEILNLSECFDLVLLPESFGDLKNLQHLNLEGSGISSLPESFGDLSNLEVLSLEVCKNLTLLPSSCGGLRKLRELNLALSGVCNLPTSFGDRNNLEVLDVGLKLLPKLFGGLRRLQDLKLRNSNVSSVPESHKDLNNLEVLSLAWCYNLELLPSAFGGLRKLRDLELDGYGVSFLPESFGDLSNLEALSLICSNLVLLPESFGRLEKLITLSLAASSSISSLPKSFGGLSSLRELDLSWCLSLEALPQSFTQLNNLQMLNLIECPARNSFISLQRHLMRADLNVSTEL